MMNMLLNSSLNSSIKKKAIIQCYGESAIQKDTSMMIDGEIINAWAIEDIPLEELKAKFTEDEIEEIYYTCV